MSHTINAQVDGISHITPILFTMTGARGATRNDILLQFLIEALLLSLFGGLVGVALGYGVAALVAAMLPPSAFVPLWAVFWLLCRSWSGFIGWRSQLF